MTTRDINRFNGFGDDRSASINRRRFAGLAVGGLAAVASLGAGLTRVSAQDGGDLSAAGLPLYQTTAALNLRSGPGAGYSVLLVIPSGAQVQGSNRYDSGYREVTYDGTTGWAYDDYLTPLGSSNPTNPPAAFDGTAVVEAATNFRSDASLNASIIQVLPAGTTVSVSDQVTNGFRYSQVNGTNGWIYDLALSPTEQNGGGDGGGDGSQNYAATTTAALNLRDAPSGTILLVMPEGTSVTVTGSASGGYLPVTYNGTNGWASADYLTTSGGGGNGGGGDGSANYQAVTTAYLNLRDAPNGSVILVMPSGARVTVLGSASQGFLPVEYVGTGQRGWASADYLSLYGSGESGEDGPASYPATTTAALNMRTGPVDGSIILVIPAGGTVYVVGDARQGYLPVAYDGISGWASADYLSTN